MKRLTEQLLTKNRTLFIYIEDEIEGIYQVNDKNDIVEAIKDYGYYNNSEQESWNQLSEMHNVKNIEDIADVILNSYTHEFVDDCGIVWIAKFVLR